jgi:RNA polymerase sigma-70 factor (ECF subfamily)
MNQHEDLSELMRRAIKGDAAGYRRLLEALTPRLRAVTRRGLRRAGQSDADSEDIVQEILLAVHLKRDTWDETQPLLPWVHAIAHYKLVDALRRRGFRQHLPIDECEDLVASDETDALAAIKDARDLLSRLTDRQREIVVAIAIDGRSAKEVGDKLGMADGTVRVTLHRALKMLADLVRKDTR